MVQTGGLYAYVGKIQRVLSFLALINLSKLLEEHELSPRQVCKKFIGEDGWGDYGTHGIWDGSVDFGILAKL